MIAYNKIWLANLRLHDQLENDLQNGRISNDEFTAIKEKYPIGFYTPGLFARIGLFILTCIVIIFVDGLITLMAGNALSSAGFPIFLGILSYAGLEVMVNVNHHYRSGVDDALLFIAGCLFFAGFFMMFEGFHDGTNHVALTGFTFLLSLVFAIRFVDMLMSAVCCVFFFLFVFFCWTTGISSGLLTAPFVMMIVSAALYWLIHIYGKQARLINYENCLIVAKVVCLLTLYAAGNYYIVQTLSNDINSNGPGNTAIPFGSVFWAWTILLPFIYLFFGIKRKDVILLRTGLLLVVVAVVTFRNYFHILPIDVTLTLLGAALLGISYSIMKYLKTPKHGFTYAEPSEAHLMDPLKVESLIIAETFSKAPSAPADSSKFGGGDFGGGGSSDSF